MHSNKPPANELDVIFAFVIVMVLAMPFLALWRWFNPPPPPKPIERAREAGKTVHEFLRGTINGK